LPHLPCAPHLVQDMEHATFSNIEHQSIDFVQHTIMPWVLRFEQGMEKDLLLEEEQDEYFMKFNVDGLLRGDYQSRMNGYATGFSNGFLSPNDIRRLENMDLIPDELGGNVYVTNGSYVKLADIGAAYVSQQVDKALGKGEQPKEEETEESEEEPTKERQEEGAIQKQKLPSRKNGGRVRGEGV